MARGKQKEESQKKNLEKKAKEAKASAPRAVQKFKLTCNVCKATMNSMGDLKTHYEAKHSKVAFNEADYAQTE
ncbi:hypothetical protein CYMTET_31253 [Cymbomonas tetramitiformis]|uniref:C2H2-type domain-containing protein n=1 Tax=Cymbomonas tetramitiformis TaxID=36881 RepID=A0AAE0FHD8_9CHLO|nr:hypothetical protein CYMTET_31253 [Cymbomonas tetramitiformis]